MNKIAYDNKMENTLKKHKLEIAILRRDYALAHNDIAIGSLIGCSWARIRVERILVDVQNKYPACVYQGISITTKGAEYKNKAVGTIYQQHVKTVNGKPYERKS